MFQPKFPMNLHWLALGITSIALMTHSMAAPRPIVIAHRGASGYLPEHTLACKALAHGMGADYLEQDLVLTRDGVPVVLHDTQIDTVTDVAKKFPGRQRKNGRYYAIDFTLAELKQLNVSERFKHDTGQAYFPNRFPVGHGSFNIPTLEEELDFIQGLNKSTGKQVGIYPEIKAPAWHLKEGQDITRIVLAVLAAKAYQTTPIFLQCFEFDEVKRIRTELGYRGRIIQLLPATDRKSPKPPLTLEEIAAVADGIGPSISQIATVGPDGKCHVSDLVRDAHALGLAVHPYTMRADELPKFAPSFDALCQVLFVDAGVDGAFTDFPDRAVRFLDSRQWP